ncbi:MAG: Na+/H+ antiporter subunit C [Nitrospinota bacterium]
MSWLVSITVGVLFTTGVYLILQRKLLQLILGLSLLSHAANLLIVASGWVRDGFAPIVPPTASVDPTLYVDPLPQAMVLTAIVIGFGVTAFLLVLAVQAYRQFGTDDLDQMRRSRG